VWPIVYSPNGQYIISEPHDKVIRIQDIRSSAGVIRSEEIGETCLYVVE